MKTNPSTRRTTRAIDRTVLRSLLAAIEAGLHDDGPGHGPLAVAIEGYDADGIDVAVRPFECADIVEALAEIEAPAAWSAFGVICEGRSRGLIHGPTGPRADETSEPRPVRLGVLVDRSGPTVAGLRQADGGFVPLPDDTALGRVPDACRRVLGLGTPPPTVPIDEFWTIWWLERVLTAGLDRPGELSWAQVVTLHPGVTASLSVPPPDPSPTPGSDARLDAGRAEAGEIGWERFRQLLAGQPDTALQVRPEIAAWMDDGMFSREVLGALPSLGRLLDELEPLVPAGVRHDIERTLRRWGQV